jgi:VWFA-related protein
MKTRILSTLPILLAGCLLPASAQDAPTDNNVVFRSDVSLVRVDTQVLDRDNRAISGLRQEDFIIRDEGRVQPIRNFARENMPLDVLFLFDVSASMGPHVQRIANAAHDAFHELGDKDRVGIMVFDRATRLRLPFESDRSVVERELERMLRQETFRGGTDITRGMLDAADYVRRQGRKDARRAIVILTDDQTEFDRDDERVGRALERADAVMSALIAPDAMAGRYGHGGGGQGQGGGGTWGNGGGIGGALGGIILGGGGMGRRGGYPGRGGGGGHTKSAGTSEIARASGGDSMSVDDASALEDTLARLRQRYALHFQVPPGAQAGQERNIEVSLSDAARRRYPDAELRFRRTYVSPSTTEAVAAGTVVVPAASVSNATANVDPDVINASPAPKRRKMVSEPDAPVGINPAITDTGTPATPPAAAATPAPATTPDKTDDTSKPAGAWRKVKPGEDPNKPQQPL